MWTTSLWIYLPHLRLSTKPTQFQFFLDAAEVPTDEGGPVASRIEARCHVVLLVAFVLVRLPDSSPPTDVFVGPYPGVVSILAAHDSGAAETAKCVGDEGIRKAHALDLKQERVFGMYLRSPFRMSSVRMKTKLGLAVIAWASLGMLPETLKGSSTVKAIATNGKTIFFMPRTLLERWGKEN
jgi:hypothetical protein